MKIHAPLLIAISGLIFSQAANAQLVEAKTVPVGVMSNTVAGSPNGNTFKITPIFVPLHSAFVVNGPKTGKISGVGPNSLTVGSAGWSAGELSAASSPFYLKLNSGSAEGRIFHITSNTLDTLTVNPQGLDLTTLGILTGASGDQFQIVKGETLASFLGTVADGVIGGSAANFNSGLTDRILANDASGTVRSFYFDTTTAPNQWRRLGSSANQDTTPVSPFAGVLYYRISTTSLVFEFTGEAPTTNALRQISNTGTTVLSTYFPVDYTLASLSANSMPGWRKLNDSGVVLNSTDRLFAPDGSGTIRSYSHDGVSWRRQGASGRQDGIAISAGSAIYVTRFGSPGSSTWNLQIPYNLN